MKKGTLNFFGLVISIFFLIACNNTSQNNNDDKKEIQTSLKQIVMDWNNAHSSKDVGVFSNLFSNSVLFYGTQQDKNTCIESKLSLFKKYPDFYQQIFGDIQIENTNDSIYKCNFVKRVTVNQKTTDYPSYLIIKKMGTEWKITTESDLVTDENLKKKKTSKIEIPEDAVKGDYNGDGILDYMWLVPPKINEELMDCDDGCISYIKFSDSNIPSIKVESCIDGSPVNEGDLNKNGTDEIGLLPGWFTSCWHSYYVWTFINGKWVNAVEPFSTHCNQWEQGVEPIDIDANREGYVIIRFSDMNDLSLNVKSKSVKIVK